jgi:hypothetical protein
MNTNVQAIPKKMDKEGVLPIIQWSHYYPDVKPGKEYKNKIIGQFP